METRGVTTTTGGNFRVFFKNKDDDKAEKVEQCVSALGDGYKALDTSAWFKRVYYMSCATTPDDPEEIRLKLNEVNPMTFTHAPVILRGRNDDGMTRRRMAVVVRFDTKADEEQASKEALMGFHEVLRDSKPYRSKPRNIPNHD